MNALTGQRNITVEETTFCIIKGLHNNNNNITAFFRLSRKIWSYEIQSYTLQRYYTISSNRIVYSQSQKYTRIY